MAKLINTGPKPPRLINTSPKPPRIEPEVLAAALGAEIIDGPHPLAKGYRPPPAATPTTPAQPAEPPAAVTPPPARPSA